MKLARTNAVLIALAALLFALDRALAPEEFVRRGAGAPLFARLAPADVAAVVLRAAVGEDGVRLERDGDGWVLADHHRFPASAWAIDEALAQLGSLGATDRIASGGGDALGLGGAEAVTVELVDARGGVLAALDQAPAPDLARGGRATGSLLRPRGSDEVFRAPLVPPLAASAGAWVELSVAKVSRARPAEATRLAVERDGARAVEVARDGGPGARWLAVHPREAVVPALRAEALLAALERLHHSRVVADEPAPEHALATPTLRFTLTLPPSFGGEARTLRLDVARAEDGAHLLTSPDWERPWVVLLPRGALSEAQQALDALLASVR